MTTTHLPPYGPERTQRLLGSFWAKTIAPIPVSTAYTLSAAATVLVMVLLPLVYIALVLAVIGALVFYFLRFGQTQSLGLVGAMIDASVALVGGVLVIFMVKPFFARRHQPFMPRPVRRDQEPLLFAFLERLCAALGAPFPKRVYLDCRPNASAGLRRGFLSFWGNDLMLILGLPLVAGLSLQQLAGVIAHELGHFTQGTGMRLSYAVFSIDRWFSRVVGERDAWDVWLERQASNTEIGPFVWVFRIATLAVRLTRRILWLFMMGAHALSCALLRQMEHDADLHEVRLVGAQTFEATCWQMSVLQVAFDKSMADLGESLRDGRLADDFAGLVVSNGRELPAAIRDKLRGMMAVEKTTLFATHPPMRQRVELARQEKGRPVFSCDLPATVLFRDFEQLTRRVSLDFYRAFLGPAVRPKLLHSLGEIVERRDRAAGDREALDRFFRGTLVPLWPFALDSRSAPPSGDEALVANARQARDACLEAVRDLRQAGERHAELVGMSIQTRQLQALETAGYAVNYGFVDEHELYEVENRLVHGTGLFAHRMMASLFLMKSAEVSFRVDEAASFRSETPALMRSLAQLNQVHPLVTELHAFRGELEALMRQLHHERQQQGHSSDRLQFAIRNALEQVHAQIKEIGIKLGDAPYPFEHAEADHTLAKDLIPEMPDHDTLELFPVSERVFDCYYDLYHRVAGRLAFIAEQLERAAGIEPLPVVGPR